MAITAASGGGPLRYVKDGKLQNVTAATPLPIAISALAERLDELIDAVERNNEYLSIVTEIHLSFGERLEG